MDNKRWVYPYDAKGERRHFKDLPKSVAGLKDDPFRSLAGELRRAGGFAKDTTPFSEFLWADFLRRKMSRKSVEDNFDKAMEKGLGFAKSKDAVYLPGWCGPARMTRAISAKWIPVRVKKRVRVKSQRRGSAWRRYFGSRPIM